MKENIFCFSNEHDLPQQKATQALQDARQYQKDWQDMGVNRVYKYFDDVDGDWLENWGEEGGDRDD